MACTVFDGADVDSAGRHPACHCRIARRRGRLFAHGFAPASLPRTQQGHARLSEGTDPVLRPHHGGFRRRERRGHLVDDRSCEPGDDQRANPYFCLRLGGRVGGLSAGDRLCLCFLLPLGSAEAARACGDGMDLCRLGLGQSGFDHGDHRFYVDDGGSSPRWPWGLPRAPVGSRRPAPSCSCWRG